MYNLHIICQKDLLLQYINIVNKAVSNRTTLPVLECILLTANDKGFILIGNDLELGIQTAPIPAEIIEQGQIAIEARIFNDIVRRFNGETVIIKQEENNMVTIASGSSEFKIMSQNPEEFPSLPKIEQNQCYEMAQTELRDMIRQTIFSVAQENGKPVLTGELFEFQESYMNIVSVDGYRISFRKNPLFKSYGPQSVIVPAKTLQELTKILSQEKEELISIYITEKHILFDLRSCIMVSRLISGEFIRYAQSFTQDYKTKMIVDKNLFIQALERASLVSRDSRKTPVRFQLKPNMLEITSRSDMGTAFEEVEADIEGEDMIIAFNPKYFIDALRTIDDDMVNIHFMGTLSPCTILPVDGDQFKYLILPLRM